MKSKVLFTGQSLPRRSTDNKVRISTEIVEVKKI